MAAVTPSRTLEPASAQSRTFVRHFDSPPEAIWPILSDTARFNEAARLPKYDIEETELPNGSVLVIGRTRVGPLTLEWRELPVNWVANRWFEQCREFRRGPLRLLCARLVLAAEGQGCRAEYTVEAAPANLLGRLMLMTRFFAVAGRAFHDFARYAEGAARNAAPASVGERAAKVPGALRARLDELVARIERSGHGHDLAESLARHVLGAQEVDLIRIRPLRLARKWAAEPRHVVELCLQAAREGLLELRWDLLCPRCRVAKASVNGLDKLPRGAHCPTCNIDYERDYSRNVEVSFAPAAQVRRIEAGEYCLFGPMSTPHVWLQLTLAAGERRSVAADLPAGRYRLRTLEPGPELEVAADGDAFPEVALEPDGVRVGPPTPPGEVILHNRSGRTLTAIVEELHWVRDALTADRVTALQAFRDLFSDQVLRPGDEVSIRRIAFMFTDLRASSELYGRIGDARAYHLVREHFAVLAAIVRAHNGAVVKTIGDAIMAAFGDPAEAVQAALEIQRQAATALRPPGGPDLVVKLGLHMGPSIAVTLNDRLDYFGSTVNMAARLEAQSQGGDIVLSMDIAEDPGVRPILAELAPRRESVSLKGFAEPVPFVRVAT